MAALAGVFLMALPTSGQGLQDVQLFAPAEFSSYGGGVRPKEGFFFSVDWLNWSTSAPEGRPIGFPSNGREAWYGPDTGDSVAGACDQSCDVRTKDADLRARLVGLADLIDCLDL